MKQPNLDEIIKAWTALREGMSQKAYGPVVRAQHHALQLLAEGQPVSAEQVAAAAELPLEQVQLFYDQFKASGGELDSDGNLVGAALTLNPTRHHFYVNGKHLYAWCSLDTMFLPGLLGQTVQVESTCPVTGDAIRLTVTPEGVEDVEPSDTVLSVIIPGITPACDTNRTGPDSAVCSYMHFFSSREAAEKWLKENPTVAILTPDEAFQLARANWIEPMTGALGSVDANGA